MAGEIWLITASRLRRLRGIKDQQKEPVSTGPRVCAACGKQAVNLADCSTCNDVYCGGECFSLHQPRGRHAA